MKEYERHLGIMGERNSYSRTDPDATFMRMKEDAMLNGQLKPGYNIQIATENQFITNYAVYQRPGDTLTLIPFPESFEKRYGKQSRIVVADAGYVSQVNVYRAARHKGSPVRGRCHKAKGEREIKVNHILNAYKEKIRDLLISGEGICHRGKRPVEPAAAFNELTRCCNDLEIKD